MSKYVKEDAELSVILYRLKSLASDFKEEADRLKKIGNIVEEGWKGPTAIKYRTELNQFIREINSIATEIDEAVLHIDRDLPVSNDNSVTTAAIKEG